MDKRAFFEAFAAYSLAYDDVEIGSGYTEILPQEVNLGTRFSRRIALQMPIVSAAMDTVTESVMAIALAKLGGIGVIHRNLSTEQQVREVERVKFHLQGLVDQPFTAYADEPIATILERRVRKKWEFNSFPVINRQGTLVGMLTSTDFDFCTDTSLQAQAVMTREPLLTAPPETSLQDAFRIMQERRKKILPLVDGEGRLCGLYTWKDAKRITCDGGAQQHNVDRLGRLRVAAAIGVRPADLDRAAALVTAGVDVLVLDTAHGNTLAMVEMITRLRQEASFASVDVVAGNVSTFDGTRRLLDAGADAIKVGQGIGSACTTSAVTGVGRGQMSALYDCWRAVEMAPVEERIPLVADGGVKYSGDIVKALAVGASCVMIGNLLAGTEEAPGEFVLRQGGVHTKAYRGMGSESAMRERAGGGRDRYNQNQTEEQKLVPEGVEGVVPYRGTVARAIELYLGGVRAGMSGQGAATIETLQESVVFYFLTPAGRAEAHPHGVMITKEAPNYPLQQDAMA